MSYMNQDGFAQSGRIQDLSFNEIDGVGGGVPMALAIPAGIALVSFAAGALTRLAIEDDDD